MNNISVSESQNAGYPRCSTSDQKPGAPGPVPALSPSPSRALVSPAEGATPGPSSATRDLLAALSPMPSASSPLFLLFFQCCLLIHSTALPYLIIGSAQSGILPFACTLKALSISLPTWGISQFFEGLALAMSLKTENRCF
jgi:hypothetical protein